MLHSRIAASRGSLSALGSAVPFTHLVMQEGDTPMASANWMRWMPPLLHQLADSHHFTPSKFGVVRDCLMWYDRLNLR